MAKIVAAKGVYLPDDQLCSGVCKVGKTVAMENDTTMDKEVLDKFHSMVEDVLNGKGLPYSVENASSDAARSTVLPSVPLLELETVVVEEDTQNQELEFSVEVDAVKTTFTNDGLDGSGDERKEKEVNSKLDE